MTHVTFLGSGGFSTALAIHLARQSKAQATIWGRDPAFCERLAAVRVNDRHLPGFPIPEAVRITCDIDEAAASADLLVASVPTVHLRKTLESVRPGIPAGVPLLSLVKGLEIGTMARPSQIAAEVLGDRKLAVLSGPSHAEEVAEGRPTSVVVASDDFEFAETVRSIFNSGPLRVYVNQDPVGVELAGALKNIMGIAAGICDGLGFGDNAKAALLTRGLVEMTRFAVSHGAKPATFFGLAGIGDLMTTCFSPHGRNRALGERLAQGLSLEQAQAATSNVVEGVFTTVSVAAAAREMQIEMPITIAVERIFAGEMSPREAVFDLMSRPAKDENFEF